MSRLKYSIVIACFFIILNGGQAQSYEVEISPMSIEGLGGLQSYSIGVHQGEWLLVGGRLDGLHQRQPFASFSADGKNQDLIVVNPEENKIWRSPLTSLPTSIAEQLASTNMQFFQNEDKLLCSGGYAYSSTVDDHITFPYLTIIDIPNTIEAIKNNTLTDSTFHQIENEIFRVTGGALDRIGDVFFLAGGHKFMGRYNPMGPDQGPGFEQAYTDEIRKFKIDMTNNYQLEILDPIHDAMHLHRRDYNLTPYISDGERELMIHSGVFKNTVDLPWLYPVSINKDGYTPHEDFTQYFNHYHCAYLPIYDEENDKMNTIFFGGIAQFYKEGDLLVQDNDVPFVNSIADVSRNSLGELKETLLTATMPGYLGASSVFIPNETVALFDEDILYASQITNDYTDVGYIYGGIKSSLPNIFWINTGTQSVANNVIYKVSIRKVIETNSTADSPNIEYLQFYPNPVSQIVRMSIDIDMPQDLNIVITNSGGKIIHKQKISQSELIVGRNNLLIDNVNVGYGAFNYTVTFGNKLITRKVIWSE